MKPGKELDKIIAEKVMERVECDAWEVQRYHPIEYMLRTKCEHSTDPRPFYYIANCSPRGFTPDYSTNMSAAMCIVDKICSFDGDSRIRIWKLEDGEWEVYFTTGECYGYSTSLPHAICLAALQAVGYEL